MSWSAITRASSIGIANPTPMLPLCEPAPAPPASEAIAVLMPMTSPSVSMSAPPELPGLMAASVWMASMTASVAPLGSSPWSPKGESSGVSCSVIDRLSALTMPALTEPSRPRGLPMASTVSPTCRSALLPRVASVRPLTSCAWMTARSVAGSRPRISASARDPSENVTDRPPSSPSAATWLLVRIWPSELMTTPDPSVPWSESNVIDTTLGKTVAAACERGSSGAVSESPLAGAALRLLFVAGVSSSSRPRASRAPPAPEAAMSPAAASTAAARRPRRGGDGGAGEPVSAGPAGGAAGGRGGAPRPAAANCSVGSVWSGGLGCSWPGRAGCSAVSVCEPSAAGISVVTAWCGAGGAGNAGGPGNGVAPEAGADTAAGAGGAGYGGTSWGSVVGGVGSWSSVGSPLDVAASLAGFGSVGSSVMSTSMPTLAADTLDGYWKFAGSQPPCHRPNSPRALPGIAQVAPRQPSQAEPVSSHDGGTVTTVQADGGRRVVAGQTPDPTSTSR